MSLTGDDPAINGDVSPTPPQAHDEQYEEPIDSQETYVGVDFELPVRPGPEASVDDEEDAYEASEDDSRENRFRGPSSTWRNYTRDERQLAATLDQLRANDLSVHLYNAHALKARHYVRDLEHLKSWSSKRKWLQPDDEGEVPWHPDATWTAWPLPSDEVPRKGEDFGAPLPESEDGTYRKVEPWTPSSDLSEELYALLLRKAKERFTGRAWSQDGLSALAEAESAAHDAPDDEQYHAGTHAHDLRPARLFQPAFLADDNVAASMVRPSVRHVLTKLDELLVGLHKSRQSHHDRRVISRSRSRAPSKRAKSRSGSADKRSKSKGPSSRNASRAPSISGGSEYEDQDSDNHGEDAEVESSTARRTRTRERSVVSDSRPPGLRDWSEVLGMASLTGWNQAAVGRAAERCASLFGEGMTYRLMPETANDTVIHYAPDMIPPESDAESDADLPVNEQTAVKGLFCPYESCPRHHQIYEKLWRWREHMKRSHKLNMKEIEDIEARLRSEADGRARKDVNNDSESAQDVDSDQESEESANPSGDEILRPIVFVRQDGKPRRRRSTFEERSLKKARLAQEGVQESEVA